ncbi:ribosomal-protein-alanine N-acetyltransferase [Salirhabdus euzebyi]|uniref:[Ribosomal protein bS18]-alanine N-acetyltransferase n=1 Tax=Salirhabdus euzebyi TaxID=394506 RepID=A0A841Q8Y5_9BACI|nr:ribosomal protein S18-alanine N-acetyltransferase [Salirhabdus euzebyi]MBB6454860.1 ribosomal-protein-alanine N-acetyltransferase [Salirhabdus euzebyi]
MAETFIREMTKEDLEKIMEIENASFATPWDLSAFINELYENEYATYYVIGNNEQVVGYCGLWVVFEAAQITNIAIMPNYRGHKYGDKLFSHAIKEARIKGATELSLEVRLSNVVAQKLYRKFGLLPVGLRKNYYQDNQEDAIVMWVKL